MVRVLLFSVLREKLGVPEIEVDVSNVTTVGGLLKMLREEHPAIDTFASVIRVAVNQEYAGPDDCVSSGDEIALITPVSGG